MIGIIGYRGVYPTGMAHFPEWYSWYNSENTWLIDETQCLPCSCWHRLHLPFGLVKSLHQIYIMGYCFIPRPWVVIIISNDAGPDTAIFSGVVIISEQLVFWVIEASLALGGSA